MCFGHRALYHDPDAAAAVKVGVDRVQRVVLLNDRAVEGDAGYGELARLLRENDILQDSAGAVGSPVVPLDGHLYLAARQRQLVRYQSLEVGFGGELRVGQPHAHPHVDAVGEQHGFLLHHACAAGGHVDKEVALRHRTARLLDLYLFVILISALLLLSRLGAGARRVGRRGMQRDGRRAQHLAFHLHRGRTDGQLAALLGREDVGVGRRRLVRGASVDHLEAAEGGGHGSAQLFEGTEVGRGEVFDAVRRHGEGQAVVAARGFHLGCKRLCGSQQCGEGESEK